MTEIVVSIVSGIFTLIGVIISVFSASKKTAQTIDKQQAVFDTKLTELTREVREHNNFARRMPVVEEQIKAINHRIDDLEKGR